jgi:hypothetical protein
MFSHIDDRNHRKRWVTATERGMNMKSPPPQGLYYSAFDGEDAMKISKDLGAPGMQLTLADRIHAMMKRCDLNPRDHWMNLSPSSKEWNFRSIFVAWRDAEKTESSTKVIHYGTLRSRPVGAALCTIDADALKIDFICSDKSVRGVGRSLLQLIENTAYAMKKRHVKLYSVERAWSFYVRAGYSRTAAACDSTSFVTELDAIRRFRANPRVHQYAAFGGKIYDENNMRNEVLLPVYSKCIRRNDSHRVSFPKFNDKITVNTRGMATQILGPEWRLHAAEEQKNRGRAPTRTRVPSSRRLVGVKSKKRKNVTATSSFPEEGTGTRARQRTVRKRVRK